MIFIPFSAFFCTFSNSILSGQQHANFSPFSNVSLFVESQKSFILLNNRKTTWGSHDFDLLILEIYNYNFIKLVYIRNGPFRLILKINILL